MDPNQCIKSFESKNKFWNTPQKSLRLTHGLFMYKTYLNHHSEDSKNWTDTEPMPSKGKTTYGLNINRLPIKIKTLTLPRRFWNDPESIYIAFTILRILENVSKFSKKQMIKRWQPQNNLDVGTIIDFKTTIIITMLHKIKHIWNEGKGIRFIRVIYFVSYMSKHYVVHLKLI